MSTKSTLALGEDFHLYHEVLDADHVYLEVKTTHFEADHGRVMLPIPIHVWEVIRHRGGAQLDLADARDEQLRERVEAEVDRRVAEYVSAKKEAPHRASWLRLSGAFVYGTPEAPKVEQVERGLAYYNQLRRHQQEIRARIETLRKAQLDPQEISSHIG